MIFYVLEEKDWPFVFELRVLKVLAFFIYKINKT